MPGGGGSACPRVELMGVPLERARAAEVVTRIIERGGAGEGGWVVTPNLDILRRLVRDRAYAELCSGASLMVADGMPLVWASRLLGEPLPERVAGSDLIWSLSAAAARAGRRVFFLGGNPGVAEEAAGILAARCPGLIVAGTHCPPVGFEDDARRRRELSDALRSAHPDIVYVALGSPKQERLIRELRAELPAAWFLGIGISFSFVSGEVRRAPGWMRACGLEWLHRFVQEPGKLFKRYFIHGIPFAAVLLGWALWSRVAGRPGRPRPVG